MSANNSSAPPEISVELRSNPVYLSGARELVSAVARRLGFTDESCGQIALAVDEAICNVIRHGYDRATDRPIWIFLWPIGGVSPPGEGCVTQGLKIVIEDEARQVDPTLIKSRDLEEIRPGGLGVHIIRAVMDDVTYERRQEKGMRLTMIKNRAAATQAGTTPKEGGHG